MFRKLAHWLRNSRHVHVRVSGVESLPDLVDLIDRFMDDKMRYPLEWDDFVSWESSAPGIEPFRERIAQTEPLFLSKDPAQVAQGVSILLEQRNRAAAFIGKPARPSGNDEAAQLIVQADAVNGAALLRG